MVSPDGRTGMIEHAAQFAEADIPFVFDPGQGLPMFDGKDLRRFVEQAAWVTVNDYEWQLLKDRTGWDVADVMKHVEALIVTRGAEGSIIYTAKEQLEIPTAKPNAVEDPTGCGDAYRAGLVYGLLRELDWETTGRVASLMGALKIECHGTQNHSFTLDEFKSRYKSSFRRSL
jgi:adenosine kinase